MIKSKYKVDGRSFNVSKMDSKVTINEVEYPLELLQEVVADALGTCSFSDCNNKLFSRGLCNKHYRKTRSLSQLDLGDTKKCTVENCGEIHHARGYCMNHYFTFIKRPKKIEQKKLKAQQKLLLKNSAHTPK